MSKTLIMGVLNLTPDSFSDGGQFNSLAAALAQAKLMVEAGAAIIDLGGESTRPGAARVSVDEEQARVLPVVRALQEQAWFRAAGTQISVDTMNAATAAAAIELGVDIINDVSGGLADDAMLATVASGSSKYVISHWRGFSDQMDDLTNYDSLVADVVAELRLRVEAAEAAGISRDRLVIDPGFGFAKTAEQNWQLAAGLDALKALGLPLLLGASRKRFVASAIDSTDPAAVNVERRDLATAVLTGLLAMHHPWAIRVHNVAATADALSIASALQVATANDTRQS
jgi:dihydropteroate synthase